MPLLHRRAVVLGLGLSGCAAPQRGGGALSLDDIVARHTQARGGAAALDAVANTLNVAQVTEPTFQVLGRYIASTEGLMRIDIFHNGRRAVSEGIDRDGDWDWPGNVAEPRPASAVARASGALAHGIVFNLYGLHALPRHGHTLTLEGRETIAGVDYYKIKLRLADGFETWRYINPQSWMIDRGRDFRALHPDVDPTPETIETEYMDYRAVGGVMTSFRWVQRNVSSGQDMQTGVMQRLDYNVPAAALNFPRNASVITL